MRIMAGETTDSRVIRIEALTFCEPIRLETNIGDAGIALGCDLGPGSMAVTAKIGNLLCGSAFEMKRLARLLLGRKRNSDFLGKMPCKVPVAMAALHSWDHGLQSECLL